MGGGGMGEGRLSHLSKMVTFINMFITGRKWVSRHDPGGIRREI
jgi:hypothetical protein